MADLTVKAGDTSPALIETIIDPATGAPANLTGATVTFLLRTLTAATPVVNAAAAINTPATSGSVTYTWQTADTATPGSYLGSFRVTTAGGATYTWPTQGYLDIVIEPSLSGGFGSTIVSLAELKSYLRFPDADRTQDALLAMYLTAVTPIIENIVGPVVVKQYEEWYSGGSVSIQLRQQPVVSLIAVSEYRGPIEYPLSQVQNPAAGSIFSVMFEPDTGSIVRRAPGGAVMPFGWFSGAGAVHVVYTAGRNPAPDNIRLAAIELIRANYQATELGEMNHSDLGDDLAGPRPTFFVPWRVREMLVPSRRHPSVA